MSKVECRTCPIRETCPTKQTQTIKTGLICAYGNAADCPLVQLVAALHKEVKE